MTIDTADQFIAFGRQLIETEDLDPLYVGVAKAGMDHDDLAAFLVSYWCFYNAGFAALSADEAALAGPKAYWAMLHEAAAGRETARAAERRHFRGDKAVQAVDTLAKRFPNGPRDALSFAVTAGATTAFTWVSERVQEWPMFGPWIAFKAADMIDRCGYAHIADAGCSLAMYDAPVKGAWAFANLSGINDPEGATQWAVDELLNAYADLRAPPLYDRPLNVFEIETVLCKTKSAMGGHYHIGKDTHEIRVMLAKYCERAYFPGKILRGMP